ncbi:MAG: adenylyltransferase/cytidyltransferase family protein [Promethearchaeota archaeon]
MVDTLPKNTNSEKMKIKSNISEIIEELKKIYPKKKEFKVMIAGTFDIIHTGHLYLINEAAKIGKVHVIVARDRSVEKFKKQRPILPEKQRLEIIRSIKNVQWAELGSDKEDWVVRIVEICPDIFLLGPNQYGDPIYYESEVKKRGCHTIFRRLNKLDNRFELNSSTKIKEKILKYYKSNPLNN